ncbi:UNVERIFIED_CONTAM: hypothetical protein HDU68_008706 [Siphonaria sp. JEL0065]|nr:hypothetical protein HDU68_008706 [Siphonaria sp. JEL0065]
MTETEAQYDEDFVPYEEAPVRKSEAKKGNSVRASKASRTTVTKRVKEVAPTATVPEESQGAEETEQAPKSTANNKGRKSKVGMDPEAIENEGANRKLVRKGTGAPKHQATEEDKEDKAWNWKHYHTLYPVANKLLAKKWDDISREKHLKKLANIKKSVDDRPPPKYIHLRTNLKRVQMEQERQILIRRNNKILIEKMSDITKHEHLVENHKEHDARVELFNRGNDHFRKQKNDRIHQENLAILERLECSKSDYDHIKVRDESVLRLHHLQNLASFPQKYIKMIKEEVERSLEKERSGKLTDTCSEHEHDRHHWHGAYGGKPVPHALEMAAFPGEEVAAFSKKKTKPKLAVADVDKAAFTKGKEVKSAVPPITEGNGPMARESSPVSPV